MIENVHTYCMAPATSAENRSARRPYRRRGRDSDAWKEMLCVSDSSRLKGVELVSFNGTLKELSPFELHFPISTKRERKSLPCLVTKIIVLTSWGSVTVLCVRCPDHLVITQGSRGRGWGPKWRTSSLTHTHTHTSCYSSEASLTIATAKNEASLDRFTHK